MNCLAKPFSFTRGRAAVEFLVAAISLFIPVVTVALAGHQVITTQLATEAAARHAARVFIQHTSLDNSITATHQAMRHALAQHGIHLDSRLDISCRPRGGCLAPNSWVDIRVSTTVPLLRIPILPGALPPTVTLTADASAQVSRYRGDP